MASYAAGPSGWYEQDSDEVVPDKKKIKNQTPSSYQRQPKLSIIGTPQDDITGFLNKNNGLTASPISPERLFQNSSDSLHVQNNTNNNRDGISHISPRRFSYLSDENEQPLARPVSRRDRFSKLASVITSNNSPRDSSNRQNGYDQATNSNNIVLTTSDIINHNTNRNDIEYNKKLNRLKDRLLNDVNKRLPERTSYVLKKRRFGSMTEISEGHILPITVGDVRLRQEHIAQCMKTLKTRKLIWTPFVHCTTRSTATFSNHIVNNSNTIITSTLQSPLSNTMQPQQPHRQIPSMPNLSQLALAARTGRTNDASSTPSSSTHNNDNLNNFSSPNINQSPISPVLNSVHSTMHTNMSSNLVLAPGSHPNMNSMNNNRNNNGNNNHNSNSNDNYCGISVIRNAMSREMENLQLILESIEIRKYDLKSSDVQSFYSWFKYIENFIRTYLYISEITYYNISHIRNYDNDKSDSSNSNENNLYYNLKSRCKEKTKLIQSYEAIEQLRRPLLALISKNNHNYVEELRKRCNTFSVQLMNFLDGEIQYVEGILHLNLNIDELNHILSLLISNLRHFGGIYGKDFIIMISNGLGYLNKSEKEIWIKNMNKNLTRLIVQISIKKLNDRHYNFANLFQIASKEYQQLYEDLAREVDNKIASLHSVK